MYKIIRMFDSGKSVIIDTNVSLADAQEWCNDPEHNSSTAVRSDAIRRTAKLGDWHDEYSAM